ncbi:MAG: Hsp70 family protein [Spirochaetaceae bacterium]
MDIYFGIDFGTTNTVISIAGKKDKIIDSFSVPTILYIPMDEKGINKVYIGDDAVERYRIEGDGRYIHSIKRSLIDSNFKHTVINSVKVSLENLIAIFLKELKEQIYQKWGIYPVKIALGRPVKFSVDEEHNILANNRLLDGFKLAGFDKILQLEEPIAATYGIDSNTKIEQENVLVIDIGGGTTDLTSMYINNSKDGISKFEVMDLDGIDIGGDNFDEDIMFKVIAPSLGLNETYKNYNKSYELPIHIFTDICKWNIIHRFNRVKFHEEIKDYLYGSSNPKAIKMLKKVYTERLSSLILSIIKDAKHMFTSNKVANIDLSNSNLDISTTLLRDSLTNILDKSLVKISDILSDFMSRKDDKFDKIIVTGGSSKLPIVKKIIIDLCHPILMEFDDNYYSSISNGLALYCKYSYEDNSSLSNK